MPDFLQTLAGTKADYPWIQQLSHLLNHQPKDSCKTSQLVISLRQIVLSKWKEGLHEPQNTVLLQYHQMLSLLKYLKQRRCRVRTISDRILRTNFSRFYGKAQEVCRLSIIARYCAVDLSRDINDALKWVYS